MKYTIVLRSNRVYQAEVEVEADNPHDAEDIALQQVNDDDYEEIDWEAPEAINVIEHGEIPSEYITRTWNDCEKKD